MDNLKKVLMDRDGLTEEQAEDQIAEAREALNEYLESGDMSSAFDVCEEYFGLEPDYLDELIGG